VLSAAAITAESRTATAEFSESRGAPGHADLAGKLRRSSGEKRRAGRRTARKFTFSATPTAAPAAIT
jgi:hypothetical protein